jgi:hypothetical protein
MPVVIRANQYTGNMLSQTDIELLTTALDLSQASAQNLEAVYGPQVVYNRAVLQRWNDEMPERTDSEWIDEQVGLMNKYGAMSLAVRRLEDGLRFTIAQGRGLEALLVHAATSELSATAVAEISKAMVKQTVVLSGRADRLHTTLAQACGITINPPPGSPIGCQVAAISRLPCGFPGVSKSECERRGCCFDDSRADASWCFEPSAIVDADFAMVAFSDPLPSELTGEMHNLSLPRRMGGGLDGTTGVIANVPCSDPIMAASQLNQAGSVLNGSGCVWWQPPDWAGNSANPPQLSHDRYGSAAMHAAVADVLRRRAAEAGLSHVHSGANWSSPATVHMWRSAGSVKVLVGNLESWWWPNEKPSVPFTPNLPRTVQVQVNYDHVGLAPGCWRFVPQFLHDGVVPATAVEAVHPVGTRHIGPLMTTATFELSVGPRGMGVWELQACVDYNGR